MNHRVDQFFSNFLIIFTFVLIFAYSSTLMAQTKSEVDSIREKVHQRRYPGGQDEEDLKVLNNFPIPEAKLSKQSVQSEVLKIKIRNDEEEQAE